MDGFLKTNIPKIAERPKSLQNLNQLKTHCTGVIVHSGLYPDSRSVHFYLNNDQFEQGGSKTVSILHDVLLQHVAAHGFLPPHLHVSADNCWRECKNVFLFSYLAALMIMGIFKTITGQFHVKTPRKQCFFLLISFSWLIIRIKAIFFCILQKGA